MKHARVWVGVLGVALWSSIGLAQEANSLNEFDVDAPVSGKIGESSVIDAACARAGVIVSKQAALRQCRIGFRDAVDKVVSAAASMSQRVCAISSRPIGEPWASFAVAEAEREVNAANAKRQKLAIARAGAEAALEVLNSKINMAAPADKAALQATAQAKQAELDQIKMNELRANADVAEAQKKLTVAKQDHEKTKAADEARLKIDSAYAALIAKASPNDFEEFLEDKERQNACRVVNDAMLNAYASVKAKSLKEQREQKDKAETDASRAEAHASDLLRKSSNTSTALSTAVGLLETPGAPDAVAFSVMTALGAERETTGTHAILTLNVASLFSRSDKERLMKGAAWRNLFLRATLPLESTEGGSIAPAAREAVDAAESGDEQVTRFQFVLGTSLLDSTDPRHADNADCYKRVIAYLPYSPIEESDPDLISIREALFDTCHGIAAARDRVALRAGIGLLNEEKKTRAEVIAAAAVWGPIPQMYLNAIYQRVLEPEGVHAVGAGIAFAQNVGGPPSGVDAWMRVGLDMLWIVQVPDDTDKPVVEGRIVPKLLFKLGDSVVSVGVGPRIVRVEQENRHTELLATVSLTYDADQLVAPLLTPMAQTRTPDSAL